MDEDNKKELKDELGFSDKELDEILEDDKPYKSQAQRRKEKGEVDDKKRLAKDAEKALKRRKEQLKKSADRFRKKRKKERTSHTPQKDLKEYNAELMVQHKESPYPTIGAPMKITPDIERILFPYFMAGASIRAIHQQFGRKQDFSLQSLYTARDFYKWEQRRNAIMKVTRNTSDLQMAERYKDYMAFFDDLISESMIRFQRNSDSGQNSNPFNNLKIKDIRDLKEIVELMMHVNSGGVKKIELDATHNHKPMSGKKRAKILEAMAMDDEEEEEDNE